VASVAFVGDEPMVIDRPQPVVPVYHDDHCCEQEMLKAMREELEQMLAALDKGIVDMTTAHVG
jgi:hypothetical protein